MIQRVTKRIIIAFAVLLITAGIVWTLTANLKGDHGVKTYRAGDGWGYSIVIKGKEVIKQPFIPAVGGRKPFETRRDAAKTGRMVLKKIQQGQQPTLTVEELKKAGIIT
jgi:hypothetical protein